MLFNDPVFILLFLPVTVAGFFVLARLDRRFAIAWLVAASLFFYGYWRAEYAVVLVASVLFNYAFGTCLAAKPSRWLLALGVTGNLALLGYYKYMGFLIGTGNELFGAQWTVPAILLPLAISFFTFQQIAYLCDCNDGQTSERNLLNYFLFVCFFPQLIAGPIVHHGEMLPQFRRPAIFRPRLRNFAIGLTIFGIGLTKKIVIADSVSDWADPVFSAAALGLPLSFFEAWVGALAFAMQLYFDFSGYSDMAIGVARIFGIRLPLNFNSPFKAHSIINFWTRWHITLSRFLATYLYNPMVLSLTRRRMAAGKPVLRRGSATPGTFVTMLALPTLATFFLAGIWHGAGFQFMVFGLLHGAYLVINHAWRMARHALGMGVAEPHGVRRMACVLTTFVAVVVSLVFFRADSVAAGVVVVRGMIGLEGIVFSPSQQPLVGWLGDLLPFLNIEFSQISFAKKAGILQVAVLMAMCWLLPNTQEWMARYVPALGTHGLYGKLYDRSAVGSRLRRLGRLFRPVWRPTPVYGLLIGAVFCFTILKAFSKAPKAFLYFNF